MDLHKAINGLQAALSEETIDGAAAYHLGPGDRELLAAFMAGLNRIAKLKFGHPGLGTTATRVDERLVIQNDIGTTDAHVIVIHVEKLRVSITHSDIHPERLKFFTTLLGRNKVVWSDEGSHGKAFYLPLVPSKRPMRTNAGSSWNGSARGSSFSSIGIVRARNCAASYARLNASKC